MRNKPSREEYRKLAAQRHEIQKRRGADRSDRNKQSIAWDASNPVDLLWVHKIAIPFSWYLSKNAMHLSSLQGGRFMRAESAQLRDTIAMLFKKARPQVVQNKVWVDILVQKPNNRGDAVNVIDLVCDGVKVGLNVDDKWFSIRRLDWEIVKENPRIFIGVGQDSDVPVDACRLCGGLKPTTSFRKRKSKLGYDPRCDDCRLTSNRKRYDAKNPRIEVEILEL